MSTEFTPIQFKEAAFFYRKHLFESDYTIEIYDSQGKFIEVFNGMTDHLYMDLSSLSAGNYSYRYYNTTTKVKLSKKFVVLE